MIVSGVEQFRRSGCVFTQRKGHSGCPIVITNGNHGRVLQQELQSPKRSLNRIRLKLNTSKTSLRRMLNNIGVVP